MNHRNWPRLAGVALIAMLVIMPTARAIEQAELAIATTDGRDLTFSVEVVSTPGDMAMGLMFRRELAPDAGMLFIYDPPRDTSFWMKNTYLPLDMLFIDADGIIRHIAERTVPLSTTSVPSRGPVGAVLEINGGMSGQLGIAVGDSVTWRETSGQ